MGPCPTLSATSGSSSPRRPPRRTTIPSMPGPERRRIGEPLHRAQDGHVDLQRGELAGLHAQEPGIAPGGPARRLDHGRPGRVVGVEVAHAAPELPVLGQRDERAGPTVRQRLRGEGRVQGRAGQCAGRDRHGDPRQAEQAGLLGGWDHDRRRTTGVDGLRVRRGAGR